MKESTSIQHTWDDKLQISLRAHRCSSSSTTSRAARRSKLSMDGLIASHHPPGLEVDRRDDQYPTAYRDYLPENDEKTPSWSQPTPDKVRICGFRRSTFWLSVAIVAILVLAATGAGVAGSLAANRKSDSKKEYVFKMRPRTERQSVVYKSRLTKYLFCLYRSTPSAQPADSAPTSSSATPSTCAAPHQSATPSSSSDNNSTRAMQPATECSSLPSLYTSQITLSKAQFDLSCETDYPGNDMLGIYVYKFATCIDACADLNARTTNTPCSAVSFDYSMSPEVGNCFLKASGIRQVATTKNTTSSAKVRTS